MTLPSDPIDRLTEIARQIEQHETAVYLLKAERDHLRAALASAGWVAPTVPVATC